MDTEINEVTRQIYTLVQPLIKGSIITVPIIGVIAIILAIIISKRKK